jgi:hypothetical protein
MPTAASDIQVWIDENNNGTYDPGEKQHDSGRRQCLLKRQFIPTARIGQYRRW